MTVIQGISQSVSQCVDNTGYQSVSPCDDSTGYQLVSKSVCR